MLSRNIKRARILMGMSQQEMANRLGCPYQTISKYERGEIKPTSDVLTKIGEEFNLDINWLLSGKGQAFLNPPENNKKQDTLKIKTQNKKISYKGMGERLALIQNSNNLCKNEMSKILGLSTERLKNLYSETALPTIKELQKIKENFNISTDWLLFGWHTVENTPPEKPFSEEELKIIEVIKKAKENNLL